MIRALVEQTFDSTKKYYVMYGLSTDTKPTSGLITGSEFHEVDTGIKYEFDEVSSEWNVAGITSDEIKDEIDAWLDDHPEATTTVLDGAISYAKLDLSLKGTVDDVANLKTEIQTKANVDGSYSSLTAGNAEQLVSTVGVEDKTPYLFRTTGGSADVGDRVKLSEITGGTVAWNQLVNKTSLPATKTDNGITFTNNGDGSVTVSGTASAQAEYELSPYASVPKGHIVYMRGCPAGGGSSAYFLVDNNQSSNKYDYGSGKIYEITTTRNVASIRIRVASGYAISTPVVFRPQLFDLTAMFGSTIADYLYTIESGTDGAGVAKLKSWGFCTHSHYAYNAGSLLSVKTSAHKEIGFNQWDEESEDGYYDVANNGAKTGSTIWKRSKNPIPCVPNTTYYFYSDYSGSDTFGALIYYDDGGNQIGYKLTSVNNKTFTTPANCHYLSFYAKPSWFSSHICINLHWDGERDGEYEPYEEHSYALDDVELRGIPKLDANNNLYYDGDSYEADGTVTRKYGIVDLATLDWSDSSATRYISKTVTGMKYVPTSSTVPNIIAAKYRTVAWTSGLADNHDGIAVSNDNNAKLYLYKDENTSTPSGYMVFELTTPTIESADPYQETQICNDFGTEEFVDNRTVPMPVGANALYQANLRAKLEMAPDSPDGGDGDYLVRQTDGLNEYVAVSDNATISGLSTRCPACPTDTDGTFVLKATVSSGAVTYAWTAES